MIYVLKAPLGVQRFKRYAQFPYNQLTIQADLDDTMGVPDWLVGDLVAAGWVMADGTTPPVVDAPQALASAPLHELQWFFLSRGLDVPKSEDDSAVQTQAVTIHQTEMAQAAALAAVKPLPPTQITQGV